MISLDTETQGLDLYHSARPYLVTSCNEAGEVSFWEWYVNPMTREVEVVDLDLLAISDLIEQADELILQNPKFDVTALTALDPGGTLGFGLNWPWHKTYDTLLAGHLLASNHPHNLTDMALHYLGVDIQPYEDLLEEAVKKARQECRLKTFKQDNGEWITAKEGLPGMPSIKSSSNKKDDKLWKNDTWLPRAFCRAFNFTSDHPWWTVASNYANADSTVTLALWKIMREEIKSR